MGGLPNCGSALACDLWIGIVLANQPDIGHGDETVQIGGIASLAPHPRCPLILPGYRTGENVAGISILFSCLIGRTPVCGGHTPPLRASSRIRVRSRKFL